MIPFSKLHFLSKLFLYPQPIIFVIWSHRSWRLLRCHGNGCTLQLVLCYINNFYGKVSSVDGQLLVSNIIDIVRFLEELWDIIGVSGLFSSLPFLRGLELRPLGRAGNSPASPLSQPSHSPIWRERQRRLRNGVTERFYGNGYGNGYGWTKT